MAADLTPYPHVHEPGCIGPCADDQRWLPGHDLVVHGCGGYFRCRSCGRRCGWCRGDDVDAGCCPECLLTARARADVDVAAGEFEIDETVDLFDGDVLVAAGYLVLTLDPFTVAITRGERGRYQATRLEQEAA